MGKSAAAAGRCRDPLFGDIPARVLLKHAPLVRVLGQVRFSKIVKISDESYIADFQEAIRSEYPHFQADTIQGVDINIAGSTIQPRITNTIVWRFFDKRKVLRVSLNPEAITLETAAYVSRDEFLGRMAFILERLQDTINPSLVDRVGFRYVNRLVGAKPLSKLGDLIQPDLLSALGPAFIEHVNVAMTEFSAKTREGSLVARFGLAPPNFSHDPDTAPPVDERSWILDVDSQSVGVVSTEFEASVLRDQLYTVAARAYAFFRWSVTDHFLDLYGGKK